MRNMSPNALCTFKELSEGPPTAAETLFEGQQDASAGLQSRPNGRRGSSAHTSNTIDLGKYVDQVSPTCCFILLTKLMHLE